MYTKFSTSEIYQVIGFFEFMGNKTYGGKTILWYAQNHNGDFTNVAIGYNGAISYAQKICTGYNAARQLFGKSPITCQ